MTSPPNSSQECYWNVSGLLNFPAQEQIHIAVRLTILYFKLMSQEEVVLVIKWLAHIHLVLTTHMHLFIRVIFVLEFTQSSLTLGTTDKPDVRLLNHAFVPLISEPVSEFRVTFGGRKYSCLKDVTLYLHLPSNLCLFFFKFYLVVSS